MNDDAELYQKSNSLQRRDAITSLKENAMRIKWKSRDRVIDIGCGDGSVTAQVLRHYLPDDYQLTGCDISEKMVKFANQHHGDDRVNFVVVNIEDELQNHLKGSFEHAFSFYALHWIKHQETAFKNIWHLLVPGGDCLLVFLGHMPVFDVYRIMSRRPRWHPWLKDVDKYVSPYHDFPDPEKKIEKMMAEIGFKNINVECKHLSFTYESLEAMKKAVKAVIPFKIPSDLLEQFLDEYVDIVRDMRLMDKVNNNLDSVIINVSYSLIVAYACK